MADKEIKQNFNGPGNFSDNTEKLITGRGILSCKGDLRITGIFTGKLSINGTLTLEKDSQFIGELVANDLIIHGRMAGSARIKNQIVFYKSSVFSGTFTANLVEIHTGSSISGERNVGKVIEKDAFKTRESTESADFLPTHEDYAENNAGRTNKNNKFNNVDPSSIPEEMIHKSSLSEK